MAKANLERKIIARQDNAGTEDLDQSLSQLTALAEKLRTEQPIPENLRLLQSAETILQKSGRWLLASDLVALLAAFICGGLGAWATNVYFLEGSFQDLFTFNTLNQFITFASLGAIALMWLGTRGHYRQRLPYWEAVLNILTVAVAGLVLGGFFQFAAKNNFSRLWLGLSWTLFAVFLFAGRVLMRRWLESRGQWRIPALIVGQGPTAREATRALSREREMGFDILSQVAVEDLDKLSKPRAWKRLMLSTGASYLFLALEGGDLERYQTALKAIARERLPYSMVPPWLGMPSSTLSAHHFMMHDVLLLHETNRLSLAIPRLFKRCFDIAGSGMLLLLLSPLFALVALRVSRDGGNVFYTQPRVGRGGKLFNCYKFRSMRSDADAVLKDYLDANPEAAEEWRQFQKLKEDPRITPFGQFIRRTSIDELPQLFNVLKGEMSLVGPRPIMQGQESYYEDDFIYYESVRPGITGPWQVSGRNMLTFKQRVALEAWYARNWSPWVDVVILLKTIPVLLKKNQAF